MPDRYPVPHIQDFSSRLAGAAIFSKIDIVRCYHQISMTSQDICKTAIITPFGLFEFLRTPFGLKKTRYTSVSTLDGHCLQRAGVCVHLFRWNPGQQLICRQHKDRMRRVFERLAFHGLVINVGKCQFGTDSIDYLGHHITSQGAVPLPDKLDAIGKFTRPTTVGLVPCRQSTAAVCWDDQLLSPMCSQSGL